MNFIYPFQIIDKIVGLKRDKEYCCCQLEQLVFLVGRTAAEDIGRSGNVKTKTTSREGMLVSC